MSHLHLTSSSGRNQSVGLLLLLTAVLLAAGSVFAQYSEPVAVLCLDISSNAAIQAALPFEPFNGSISTILSDQLTGNADENNADRILAWDVTAQEYLVAYKSQDGRWLESGTNSIPALFELTAGDGFFVENRHGPQTFFLAGRLGVDADTLKSLEPGFNLVGIPQITDQPLNQTDFIASGANGSDNPSAADQVIVGDGGINWLLGSSGHPLNENWVTGTGMLSSASLSVGDGFWYVRRGTNTLDWLEENLAFAFGTPSNQPVIADIIITNGTVTLSVESCGTNLIELFHQDVGAGQTFPVDDIWMQADENLSGGTKRLWTESALTNFECRVYVAAAQIDTDADNLSDARETLIYKTDVDLADTDADGADDGFEVLTSLTQPLNPDTDADGMSDGSEIYHAANPLASNAYARLPWTEPFDHLAAGSLEGQNNWQADNALVQSNTVAQGSKALELTASDASGQALQTFGAYGITNVWIDMMLNPRAGALPEANVAGRSAALLAADPAGRLAAYDGTFQEWIASSNMPAATGQWLRVTMGLNYQAKTWRLNVDNILMAQNLGFKDNQTPELTHAAWKNSALGNAYLDEVSIVTSEPGHLDDDGDTLPNVWEKAQGLDAGNAADASRDSDGDALSNTDEYAAGTDALNADTDNDILVDGMEILFAENPVSSNQYQQIPWEAGFENGEGYTLGDADSQNGWNAAPQDAAVITGDDSAQGTNSLLIKSSSTQIASVDHWSVSSTGCVVWTEMNIKTVPAPLPASIDITGNSALFMLEGSHHFAAYDGAAGSWVIASNTPSVDYQDWQLLAVCADYRNATWSLYWNNEPIIKNIGFADPSLKQMVRFALKGGNSLGDGLDALSIKAEKPLTIDEDADGLPDCVEDVNQNGIVDAGETDANNPDSDDDGMIDGNEVLFSHDPVSSNAFSTVSWSTGFEGVDGYTNSLLNGQNGWVATSAIVQQDDCSDGTQAITLNAESAGAEVRKDFGTWPEKVLWFDSCAKLCPGQLPDPSVVPNAAVLVALNPEGLLCGWDSETMQWVKSPLKYITNPDEWTRITFCVDYNHKTWSAYIGSIRIFKGIHFADSSMRSLARIAMRQPPSSPLTGSSKWDQLTLSPIEPVLLDNDGDGLPNAWETQYGLNPEYPADALSDEDGDNLSALDEYAAGVNPNLADTDGDGVGDYIEVFETYTDPLSLDIFSIQDVLEIDGADYAASLGYWSTNGTSAYAQGHRGSLTYEANLPVSNVFSVTVCVGTHSTYNQTNQHTLLIYLDDEYIGRRTLRTVGVNPDEATFITPWLPAGEHSIKIFWDNASASRKLHIDSLFIQTMHGVDSDADGMDDWVENRLAQQCIIKTNNVTSYVSPYYLEGHAAYSGLLEMSAVTARRGPGNMWYADIPLCFTGTTPVNVSFQNGAVSETLSLQWTPLNILHAANITVRNGDSLRLTALHETYTGGTVQVSIVGLTNMMFSAGENVTFTFDHPGRYELVGTYLDEDGQIAASNGINVIVKNASFNSSPACWVDREREWQCPNIGDDVTTEFSGGLMCEDITESSNTGKVYRLVAQQPQKMYAVARLYPDGPVITNAVIHGFDVRSTSQTYLKKVDEYPDGSEVFETGITGPIPDDVSLSLEIIVGGLIFEDGATTKTITSQDLDELDSIGIRFIRDVASDASICHFLKAYQNSNMIGQR